MLFAIPLLREDNTVIAALQGPGAGWVMVPTPERTIKTIYWDLFKQTEIWTRIVLRDKGRIYPAGGWTT